MSQVAHGDGIDTFISWRSYKHYEK